jgi:hypothetical protein
MQKTNSEPIFYEVDAVLDRRLIQGKVYYLVKWKGYPESEATWEYSRRLPYIRPLIRKFNINAKLQRERTTCFPNSVPFSSEEESL